MEHKMNLMSGWGVSDPYTNGINVCNDLLDFIKTVHRPSIENLIKELKRGVEDAEKLRRDILISKTTGVAAGSTGAALTIIGLALAPFTLGISAAVLSGIGISVSVLGSATTITASIVKACLETPQAEEINKLLNKFRELQDDYKKKIDELQDCLQKSDCHEREFLVDFLKSERRLDVTNWLKNGHLHQDKDVEPDELRMGDHIFRVIDSFPCNTHHGIYINEHKVVELIKNEGVKSSTLQKFQDRKQLIRRQYGGFDLPPDETAKLVKEALNTVSTEYQYSLINLNCEHFATSMKIKIGWSSQVHTSLKVTSEIGANIPRPISLVMEGVEAGFQISAATAALAPKGFFSIFQTASVSTMSNLSKAALVLAPISVALDITSLVFDYRQENVTVDICLETIKILEKQRSDLHRCIGQLKEQTRILAERRLKAQEMETELKYREEAIIAEERMENERREREMKQYEDEQRWRKNMEIKIIGFVFTYFLEAIFSGLNNF